MKKDFISICLIRFLMSLSWRMINILLVIYASTFEASAFHGTMWSVIGVSRFLAETPGGMIIDRIGSRRVILGGLASILISYIRYASAQTPIDVLIASVLAGAGFAVATLGLMVQATYYTPPNERVRYMGLLNGSMMASSIVGPTIGGIIAEYFELRAPFSVSALTISITLLLAIVTIRDPETREKRGKRKRSMLQEYRMFITNDLYLSLFFVSFLFSLLGWGFRSIVLPTYGRNVLSLTTAQIGLLSSISSSLLFLEQFFLINIMERRLSRKFLITLGLLLYSVAIYSFTIPSDMYGLAAASIILGLSLGIITPILEAIWIDITKTTERGRIYGVRIAFFDLGQISWSMIITSMANTHPHLPFYTIILVALCITIIIFHIFRKTLNSKHET